MIGACLLLLTACATPELSEEGARVRFARQDPSGCRAVATLREAEGGGMRSYAANRKAAEARIRNEAGRLGGNAVVLVKEVHGESEEGARAFQTGVAGLATPNPVCSNCVILEARAYACERPLPEPVAETPHPPLKRPRAAPPPVLPPPEVPAAEPAEPAEPIIVPAPAAPPVIIIIQPAHDEGP